MPTSSWGRAGRSSSSIPLTVGELPLTASASRILPEFLASDRYRSLLPVRAASRRRSGPLTA